MNAAESKIFPTKTLHCTQLHYMVSQAVKTIVQELRSGLKAGRLLPINYPVTTCGGLSGNDWQETTSQRSTEPEPEPLRHRERDRHG